MGPHYNPQFTGWARYGQWGTWALLKRGGEGIEKTVYQPPCKLSCFNKGLKRISTTWRGTHTRTICHLQVVNSESLTASEKSGNFRNPNLQIWTEKDHACCRLLYPRPLESGESALRHGQCVLFNESMAPEQITPEAFAYPFHPPKGHLKGFPAEGFHLSSTRHRWPSG